MTPRSLQSARLRLVFVPNLKTFHPTSLRRGGSFNLTCEGLTAGLLSLVATAPGQAVIGYDIVRAFRGRGLASEAVAAVIAAAPGFGLSVLSASCRSDNSASRRVLEKSGFVLSSSKPFFANGQDDTIRYMVFERSLAPN
jgi:RimJ/RimL family protein N-acetyltransferase